MVKKIVKVSLIFAMAFQMWATPFVVVANEDEDTESIDEIELLDADDDLLDGLLDDVTDEAYLADELDQLIDNLSEPVGMQGFSGDDALSDDPDEMVEIIVQLLTPPQVMLELADEVNEGRPIGTRQLREGRNRRGNRNRFRDEALSAHETFNEQLSDATDIEVLAQHHELFNGQLLRVPAYRASEIAQLPEVYAVFPNITIYPLTNLPPSSGYFMQTARDYLNLDHIHDSLGITGNGVRVAVLDSGIDHQHPRFANFLDDTGRVRGWQRLDNTASTNPNHAIRTHGTEVSGVVIAVATEIELWHYRLNFSDGAGGMGVISAITAAHQDGMDVINLSFGSALHSPFNVINEVVNLAVLDGVVVVAAAGNTGSDGPMAAPGSASLAITVGSGYSGGISAYRGDRVRSYSAIGLVQGTGHLKPDVIAPSGLVTPTLGGGYRDNATGTSFSAPVVAGLAALLIEAFPDASPSEIRARIMNTARPLTGHTPNQVFYSGAGFIQPLSALTNETIVTVEHDIPLAANPDLPLGSGTMASLSFGFLESDQALTIPIHMTNRSNMAQHYTIHYTFANHLNVTSLNLSADEVVVDANGTASLEATVHFAETDPIGLYEGFIDVKVGDAVVARLPFAAIHGELVMLPPTEERPPAPPAPPIPTPEEEGNDEDEEESTEDDEPPLLSDEEEGTETEIEGIPPVNDTDDEDTDDVAPTLPETGAIVRSRTFAVVSILMIGIGILIAWKRKK